MMTPAPIYQTPAALIGRHEWRCIVYPHATYGACTAYLWRRQGAQEWCHHRDWPAYDDHDTFNGLPRTLGRLYDQHEREIKAALGRPLPADPQLGLAL